MQNENLHPIFQKILAPITPPEEDAFTQLDKLHRRSLNANTALMRGYKLLLAALNMDGINRQTLRDIISKALGEASEEIGSTTTKG